MQRQARVGCWLFSVAALWFSAQVIWCTIVVQVGRIFMIRLVEWIAIEQD